MSMSRPKTKRLNRSLGGDLLLTFVLSLMAIVMVLPFVYAVVNAFKPLEEFYLFPPKFYVINPTPENFLDLLTLTNNLWVPFTRYLFNSLYLATLTTVISVVVGSTTAYVLAKKNFHGKNFWMSMITTSMLFTSSILGIPQYVILSKLGWVDTHWAIIAPVVGSTMGVFLMKQFMEGVPDAIIESARIDGAGDLRICWTIVMPMVKPAWITLGFLAFQSGWANSGSNLIYTENLKLLPTILAQISASGMARAGVGAAATLLMMLPPIVTFVATQSRIIETMASSGIKD
ncbi:MAG: carbohydrate ABC transporter permease [Clostridia bacterium]|nr:carbohydrate ABC transporter permease [Clostridia bacterium]